MMMNKDQRIIWAISQHEETNHKYDKILPYSFHLAMVAMCATKYITLINEPYREDVICAAWGHDLIEDCRVTYNDVKNQMGEYTANIIYAVTNPKGKNRAERGNVQFYQEMHKVNGAIFVKLCDRLANASYSVLNGSRMADVYRTENDSFLEKIGYIKGVEHEYQPLIDELINVLK